MRELRSKAMRRRLSLGILAARRKPPPAEGMMTGLKNETLRNGWHYQVEYIHDLRMRPRPFVVVYAWKPQNQIGTTTADFFLEQGDRG